MKRKRKERERNHILRSCFQRMLEFSVKADILCRPVMLQTDVFFKVYTIYLSLFLCFLGIIKVPFMLQPFVLRNGKE